MEFFRSQLKKKLRIQRLFKSLLFMVGFTWSLQSLATASSSHEVSPEGTTTTSTRPWPSHDFFVGIISTSTNKNKTETKNAEAHPSETQQIAPIKAQFRDLADERTNSSNGGDNEFPGSHSTFPILINESTVLRNTYSTPSFLAIDSRNFNPYTNKSDTIDVNPVTPAASIALSVNQAQNTSAITKMEMGIPLQIVDNRKSRFQSKGGNPIRAYYVGGLGVSDIENGWEKIKRNPSTQTYHTTSVEKEVKSIFPTAPSISLFTGNPTEKIETSVRSPLIPYPTKKTSPSYSTEIPTSNWRFGDIKIAGAVKNTHTSKMESLDRRHGILYSASAETQSVQPMTMGMSSQLFPRIPTPNSEQTENILLKVWSYSDEGLKLSSNTQVPSSIFSGSNFSEGSVLNIDDFPHPVRKLFKSPFNLTNLISKRHSGPGSSAAFHWQQLPSVLPKPTSEPLFWTKVPKKTNPVALNCIVLATTSTPPLRPYPPHFRPFGEHISPPVPPNQINFPHFTLAPVTTTTTTTPPPKDYGYQVWLNLKSHLDQQLGVINNNTTPQKETGDIKLQDKDILASVASMALILSKINKDALKYPETSSHFPNKNSNFGIFSVTPSPINKAQFWSSLFPVFLHYLKYGSSATSKPLLKPSITSIWGRDPEGLELSGTGSTDYNFYPQQSPAPVTNDALPTRTNILKQAKKGLKKIKKKLKKKKKSKRKKKKNGWTSGGGWGNHHQPFDISNIDFGASFDLDILGALKRIFYAILALKFAPLIILAVLALGPLLLLFFSKLFHQKIWNFLWKIMKSLFHHHHHHPHHNHHHHPHLKHHRPHHNHHGWQPHQSHHHGSGAVHHHFHGYPQHHEHYPTHHIDHLVHESYGDHSKHRADNMDSNVAQSDAGMVLYDTDLNTAHNLKVMEILMESKNATLQKLLDSWEINFPPMADDVYSNINSTESHRPINFKKKKMKIKK